MNSKPLSQLSYLSHFIIGLALSSTCFLSLFPGQCIAQPDPGHFSDANAVVDVSKKQVEAFPENYTVRGTVFNKKTKKALPGVTVSVFTENGFRYGDAGDENGNYVLKIPLDSLNKKFKIEVSYIGYHTKTKKLRRKKGKYITEKDLYIKEKKLKKDQVFIVCCDL
jgi:hypothetical protein